MPIELTVPDRETAEKFCDAVAELVGERPEPVKAYVVPHPGVSQAEAFAILAMIQHLRKTYIYPETIRGVANGKILKWAVKFFHSHRDQWSSGESDVVPFDLDLFSPGSVRSSGTAIVPDHAGLNGSANTARNSRRERARRGPRRIL